MYSLVVLLGICNIIAAAATMQQPQNRPRSNGVGKIYRKVL